MGIRFRLLRALALAAALALLASPANVAGPVEASGTTTCSGGPVAPGVYRTLSIDGACVVVGGSLTVLSGLTVAPGATLIATTSHATVTISGGVRVGRGAVFMFGCAPSLTELCGPDTSYVISGDVVAAGALAVIMHGNTIHGSVTIAGGGGGVTCAPLILGGEAPAYSTFEGNAIDGTLAVSGMRTCWFGIARNEVARSVILSGNVEADPDSNEVIDNSIEGALVCFGNSPLPHNDGQPNSVTGPEVGQCAGL